MILDTDSLAVTLIDAIENLVKLEKRDTWPEMKKKWFVIDLTDARDL